METSSLVHSPFSVLTFIVAPALLTNASSLLVLSTINRMLRAQERMHELFAKSQEGGLSAAAARQLVEQVDRVETQASLLLRGLRCIYVALASFAIATLVTLLGSSLASFQNALWLYVLSGLGIALGFVGVSGLVLGCVNLFRATQVSLTNLCIEASLIRQHQEPLLGKSQDPRLETE
jgi:hypothetical protein